MTTHLETTACEGACTTCPSVGSCADRLVCRCLKITEHEVITAIRAFGTRTLLELRQVSEAGTGCTCCHKELKQYLKVYAPIEENADPADRTRIPADQELILI